MIGPFVVYKKVPGRLGKSQDLKIGKVPGKRNSTLRDLGRDDCIKEIIKRK